MSLDEQRSLFRARLKAAEREERMRRGQQIIATLDDQPVACSTTTGSDNDVDKQGTSETSARENAGQNDTERRQKNLKLLELIGRWSEEDPEYNERVGQLLDEELARDSATLNVSDNDEPDAG